MLKVCWSFEWGFYTQSASMLTFCYALTVFFMELYILYCHDIVQQHPTPCGVEEILCEVLFLVDLLFSYFTVMSWPWHHVIIYH